MDFNGLVLDDQMELEKNKICFLYLLLEKMRFPGSFVGYPQIIAEIQGHEVGGVRQKSAFCGAG